MPATPLQGRPWSSFISRGSFGRRGLCVLRQAGRHLDKGFVGPRGSANVLAFHVKGTFLRGLSAHAALIKGLSSATEPGEVAWGRTVSGLCRGPLPSSRQAIGLGVLGGTVAVPFRDARIHAP